MRDTDEILAPFTFSGSSGPITVPDAILTYQVFQQPPGGVAPVLMVTTGPTAVFDLFVATPAEIAAEFPGLTPLPLNAVWVAGKGLLSPVGNFSVRATAAAPGSQQVPKDSPTFPVTRDPAIPTSGVANPLGTPRPRQHP